MIRSLLFLLVLGGAALAQTLPSPTFQNLTVLGTINNGAFYNNAPQSYGAVCDGTLRPLSLSYQTLAAAQAAFPNAGVAALTDQLDWAALQQAIYTASIVATSQPRVVNISGNCRVGIRSTTWCFDSFALRGTPGTTITYDGTTGNVLQTCGTTRIAQPTISNITIVYTAVQTSGYAVSLDNTYTGRLEDFGVYGNNMAWQGVYLGRSDQTTFLRTRFQNTLHECFVLAGIDAAAGAVSDVHFEGAQMQACNIGITTRAAALTSGQVKVGDFVGALFFNPGTEIYDGNGYAIYFAGTAAGTFNLNAYINGINIEECASWCGGIGGDYFSTILISAGSDIIAQDMDAINLGQHVINVGIGGNSSINAGPGVTGAASNGITFDGSELRVADVDMAGQGAGTGAGIAIGADADYVYVSGGARIRQWTTGISAAATSGKHISGNGISFRSNTADFGSTFLTTNLIGGFDTFTSSNCNPFVAAAATIVPPVCGGAVININGTATPIANMTGVVPGQKVTLNFQTSGQTLLSSGNIKTLSGSTYAPSHAFVVSSYIFDGALWWQTAAGS